MNSKITEVKTFHITTNFNTSVERNNCKNGENEVTSSAQSNGSVNNSQDMVKGGEHFLLKENEEWDYSEELYANEEPAPFVKDELQDNPRKASSYRRDLLTAIKLDWSKEAVLKLIELWENYECLYNPKNRYYHNKRSRYDALNAIAKKLKTFNKLIGPADVKYKIQYLRGQYTREITRIKEAKQRDDVYIPNAYWFNQLEFLKNFVHSRKGHDISYLEDSCGSSQIHESDAPTPRPSKTSRAKKRKDNFDLYDQNSSQLEDAFEMSQMLESDTSPNQDRKMSMLNTDEGHFTSFEQNSPQIEDSNGSSQIYDHKPTLIQPIKRSRVENDIQESNRSIYQKQSEHETPEIALQKVSSANKTSSLERNEAFCNFIKLELNSINSESIKDDLIEAITLAIFEAKKKERKHNNTTANSCDFS
ncbi:uncharacterized protein [Musca autumnalis]|uniref:uncharacterized protein n=1 Tax=Musca autumnalis TaxID=221902 RepID=UPI003CECE71D